MWWYHEFDHDFALCLFLSLIFLSFCFLRIPKLLSLTSIYEQGVFEETLNTLQKKIDDMKKTQAQCEETIRLKNNFMVIKFLSWFVHPPLKILLFYFAVGY